MKRIILTVLMLLICTTVCFAEENDVPKTKVESVLLKSGVLYQKQSMPLGDIDNIEFSAVIITDQNDLVTAKGLKITVPGYNRLTSSSWLDVDEVNDLLKAIEYMISSSKSWDGKPLKSLKEVVFSTKDHFRLSFYGKPASLVKINDLQMVVSSGYGQKTSSIMDIEHLEEFKNIINKGLVVLK